MTEWFIQYWLEALFGGVLALMGIFCHQANRKFHEMESLQMGVQALLRDRIIQTYNYYMDKGYCPIHALENVHVMYREYHNLGGNGTVTKLVEELDNLPTDKRKDTVCK